VLHRSGKAVRRMVGESQRRRQLQHNELDDGVHICRLK
jgi:hypothetical protein